MIQHTPATRLSCWIRAAFVALIVAHFLGFPGQAAFAAGKSGICATNSANRDLDFWLGDWVITYPGADGSSSSTVSLALDQCVVLEKWHDGKNHDGENLFAYSSDDKSWHGMFVDNEGRVHVFEGTVAAGRAEFHGPSRGANGEAELNRITVIRVSANRVSQIWEKSADNGVSWNTEFHGDYVRRR